MRVPWSVPPAMADGAKDILGLWIETSEGAKFWLRHHVRKGGTRAQDSGCVRRSRPP